MSKCIHCSQLVELKRLKKNYAHQLLVNERQRQSWAKLYSLYLDVCKRFGVFTDEVSF